MTTSSFAEAMGWPRQTGWRRLNQGSDWSVDEIERAASVLSVSVAHLMRQREPVAS